MALSILHLPSSIGLNAYNLSLGEKKNGFQSTVLINDPSIYSNRADIIMRLPDSKYLKVAKMMAFCATNARKYNVFHYNFGTALINTNNKRMYGLDVKWFKRPDTVVAVTYQGSDARQADYCVENYDTTYYTKQDVKTLRALDQRIRERIAFFEEYADLIYATNPDLLNVLPKRARFRPYTKLQPGEWTPCYSDYSRAKTVILHAPTSKNKKGTAYVDAAVERLRAEGYEIQYALLQNIPNNEVIEYYKKADLVIDQLLTGWYGGFAVECMALGKPVMCYIRESDMRHIPEEMDRDMPIIRVTKDDLYHRLKYFLEHKEQLKQIARQSRQYIEKWHDPEIIAKSILDDYQYVLHQKLH